MIWTCLGQILPICFLIWGKGLLSGNASPGSEYTYSFLLVIESLRYFEVLAKNGLLGEPLAFH